jgi:uncharacterized membrane protein YcgQ (UPF0703/DUF1980 family)
MANCKSLVTDYIITNDPYYKLHFLVTLVLYGLLYVYYLKEQQFEEYENRFVVFSSKYILMPVILGFIVSTVFYYAVQLSRKKLVAKADAKCRASRKKVDDIVDSDLRRFRAQALGSMTSSSRKSSSKKSSSKKSSSKKSSSKRNS